MHASGYLSTIKDRQLRDTERAAATGAIDSVLAGDSLRGLLRASRDTRCSTLRLGVRAAQVA
jgi:hypothetical protein